MYVIESLDGSTNISLPTLIECNQIPNMREEIPTPEVARYHEHLKDIADEILPYDPDAPILLGLDQSIGPSNSPYAKKTKAWMGRHR